MLGCHTGRAVAQGSPCWTRACQGLFFPAKNALRQLIPPDPGRNECVDRAQEEEWPGCVFGLTSVPISGPPFSPSCVKMETMMSAVVGKGFEIYRFQAVDKMELRYSSNGGRGKASKEGKNPT